MNKEKKWLVCKTCHGKCIKITENTKAETIKKFLFEKHKGHELTTEIYQVSGTILLAVP